MTITRLRWVLLGLLVLTASVFIIVTVAGSAMLSKKSSKLVELKLRNKTLDAQLTSLAQAKKDVEKYSYFNDVAASVIPSDKDQAQALLDISKLAAQSGISIASVTFPASSLGSAGTQASGAPLSQAKPVTAISGLYSLELTISPQTGPGVPADKVVTYPKALDFLSRIERNRRTAQITEVNIQPQGEGQLVSFGVKINIFIKP